MWRIGVCLLSLLIAFQLPAEGEASRLADSVRSALEVSFPETPELRLHDALGRLRVHPDAAVDLETVRAAATTQKDPSLAPILNAIVLLGRAADEDLQGYRTGVTAFRKSTDNARLLALVDVSDALMECPECGGREPCSTCGGSLKCRTCGGKGFALRRGGSASLSTSRSLGGTSLGSSGQRRLRCAACKGTGKCPACGGVRERCATCRDSGRVPDPRKVGERIAQLAGIAQEHTQKTQKQALDAREQTALLREELLKVQRVLSDPSGALAVLNALPSERAAAAQWSHLSAIRANLEALVRERDANSAQKQAARANIRAAITQAQRAQDPLNGMAVLVPLFETYADSDALPEAKTAFEGLLASVRTRREAQYEALDDRITAIAALKLPADRIAQAAVCLADWPETSLPKVVQEYARTAGNKELAALGKDERLATLRARLESLRRTAAQEQAEAEAKPAWWIWAAVGVGGLVVLYFLWSMIQGVLERRAEAARKARQRAAIESIRNTFSHRRGQ